MRISLGSFFIFAIVLFSGIVLLSGNVSAATPTTPYFQYAGGAFDYDAGTNELVISGGTIGMVAHADGGFAVRDSNAFEQLITESQEQLEILYGTRARLTRFHAEVRELVTVILRIGCVEPGLLEM